jgi:hypothetical protein
MTSTEAVPGINILGTAGEDLGIGSHGLCAEVVLPRESLGLLTECLKAEHRMKLRRTGGHSLALLAGRRPDLLQTLHQAAYVPNRPSVIV